MHKIPFVLFYFYVVASAVISSLSWLAITLHLAATFFATAINAWALGEFGSVTSTGLPLSELSIMPGFRGMPPKNADCVFHPFFLHRPYQRYNDRYYSYYI